MKIFRLAPILMISACVSNEMQIKSDEYGITHEVIATRFGQFNVYEHPSGRSLMVTPILGDVIGQAVVNGLTLGAADTTQSEGAMQEAADAYLKKHEVFKGCFISNGYLIQKPAYEFILECKK